MAIKGENQQVKMDEVLAIDPASKDHAINSVGRIREERQTEDLKDEVVHRDESDEHDRYVKIAEE